jgi:hypothetical protein
MILHHRLLEISPGFRERQAELEHATIQRRASRVVWTPPTIPVVVHVVYNTPEQNIDDNQIRSQIDALNRDYNKKNIEVNDPNKVPPVWAGLVANAQIQFALVATAPDGSPTTGITRTSTTRTSFTDDDAVKSAAQGGADGWPSGKYLNIWVCNLASLLGYAQFPGGPPQTDGVVILYTAFGTSGTAADPFNLGRTVTHEMGHWLNLRHIWGDTEDCTGSDFVDDTPPQQLPNYGKPKFPHISCNNGPNGDMFMNYMDYVDDDTMCMFTPGQVVRMHAALAGPRNTLANPASAESRK